MHNFSFVAIVPITALTCNICPFTGVGCTVSSEANASFVACTVREGTYPGLKLHPKFFFISYIFQAIPIFCSTSGKTANATALLGLSDNSTCGQTQSLGTYNINGASVTCMGTSTCCTRDDCNVCPSEGCTPVINGVEKIHVNFALALLPIVLMGLSHWFLNANIMFNSHLDHY